jgi:hypothetical protein
VSLSSNASLLSLLQSVRASSGIRILLLTRLYVVLFESYIEARCLYKSSTCLESSMLMHLLAGILALARAEPRLEVDSPLTLSLAAVLV